MRKVLTPLMVTLLIALLMGCLMKQTKSFQDMTPKEKVTWMFGVYNSQFADYQRVTGHTKDSAGNWIKTSSPVLSEEQKEVLRTKKKGLDKVYPLIKTYDGYVSSNVTPSRATEDEIIGILNSLTGL